jgi:hypothetical protein
MVLLGSFDGSRLGQVDQGYAIQPLEPYLAIQVRFQVNDRLAPLEVFIAKEAEPGYQFGLPYPVGGANPAEMLRYLHAQDTSIPPALLACLRQDGWMLKTFTPAP